MKTHSSHDSQFVAVVSCLRENKVQFPRQSQKKYEIIEKKTLGEIIRKKEKILILEDEDEDSILYISNTSMKFSFLLVNMKMIKKNSKLWKKL